MAHVWEHGPEDRGELLVLLALDGIALALGIDDKHFRPVSSFGEKRNPACVVVTLEAA